MPDKLGTSHAKSPWRSRAFNASHAPRQRLTQACVPGQPRCGFHGVEHPSSPRRVARLLQVFDRLISGSFNRIRNHRPDGPLVVTPRRASSNSVAKGHFRRAPSFAPVLPRRREAALNPARAREKNPIRCPRSRTALNPQDMPTRHPMCPGNISSVSSSGTSENKLQMLPPRGGQIPPRQPCRPDRDALRLLQASRPAVSVCRRSSGQAHPPPLLRPRAFFQTACHFTETHFRNAPSEYRSPGLSAPERKARSQSRLRPRKLRVIRLSLRSSRVAAASRLRQSCRRDRSPVAHPRDRHPVRRSRHPAAYFPLAPFAPKGGRVPFAAARGSRAGSACKRRMGILPMPLFSARDFSRRIHTPDVIGNVHPLCCMLSVFSARAVDATRLRENQLAHLIQILYKSTICQLNGGP